MLKSIIAKFYLFYINIFPLQRGKVFIARIITALFGSFVIRHKDGLKLELLLNSQMDLSYLKIEWKKPDIILREISKLNSGSKFLDIGANIGFYTLMASKIVGKEGRIYSFEPSLREYKRLLNNIEINNCDNVISYNLAVSNMHAELELSIAKGHTGLNSLLLKSDTIISKIQPVQTVTLDSIFFETQIDFDLVKIDVEGAEYLVLLGMQKLLSAKRIKKLVIEITPKYFTLFEYDKETLYNFLESFAFEAQFNSNQWQYDEIFTLKLSN